MNYTWNIGLSIYLEMTQGRRKIGTSLLVIRHMGNLKMADSKKSIKQNINNIVAAQGIAPTGAVLYENVTRMNFYGSQVLVNTVLRKVHYFKSFTLSSFHFWVFLRRFNRIFNIKVLIPPKKIIVKTILICRFPKHYEILISELLIWNQNGLKL